MTYKPYSEREFENKKTLEHGYFCNVCSDFLEGEVIFDEEWCCGECTMQDWDSARKIIQIEKENE